MHSINAFGGDYVRNQLILSVTNSLTFSKWALIHQETSWILIAPFRGRIMVALD
jgi:hypothetical protein